jgi:hypothetical protein
MHMPTSAVALCKVTHTGKEASFGLRARRDILAWSCIKETCSSMSLDAVTDRGPSIIQAARAQIPPHQPGLILGPFRFVNHDCDPNSQVSDRVIVRRR